jgi:hypothetical protein
MALAIAVALGYLLVREQIRGHPAASKMARFILDRRGH